MTRLSSPIANIKAHYTAVVVGSGYGGGIAASRLARAGQRVCVVERGKEFQPGEYPDTLPEAIKEMQADLPDRHIGPHTGLYDLSLLFISSGPPADPSPPPAMSFSPRRRQGFFGNGVWICLPAIGMALGAAGSAGESMVIPVVSSSPHENTHT